MRLSVPARQGTEDYGPSNRNPFSLAVLVVVIVGWSIVVFGLGILEVSYAHSEQPYRWALCLLSHAGIWILGLIGLGELVRSKKEALETEARFRRLAEGAPIGLSLVDKERRFHYVNPKFTEVFGYSKDEAPDESTLFIKTSPRTEHGEAAITEWRDVTTFGLEQSGTYRQVFRCTRKDGSERIVGFQAVALDNDELIVTYEDKTIETKALQELRRSEHRYRHLLENAPLGFFLCDVDGDIQETNRELETLLSTDSNEALRGCNVCESPALCREGIADAIRACFETGAGSVTEHPYSTADGSTSRKYGGTRLGLAITSQLLELMGGRIWVESLVGRGSSFHFTLPLGIQKAPAVQEPYERIEELRGLKVLIVDDNATNRRILAELIRRWGMLPSTAESGAEALSALEDAYARGVPVGLALVDCMMPEMDGFELAERIRRSPYLARTPLLMLTSASPDFSSERCRAVGIDDCLLKPIHHSHLYNAFSSLILGRRHKQPGPGSAPLGVQKSANPLKILLAEDNTFNQKVAVGLLEKMGHQVSTVFNGREAVQAAQSERFDLILMDVQMPLMDGFQATKAIRELESRLDQRTPIIAMTAYAMAGDREKCLAEGMDGYLSKPIKGAELYSTIENLSANLAGEGTSALGRSHSGKVVDLESLLEVVGGDRDMLGELLHIFRTDCPNLLEGIRSAVEQREPEMLLTAAHSLKGMLGGVGAEAAFQAALRMENMGRGLTETDDWPEGLASLEQEIDRVMAVLDSEVGRA